MAGLPRLRLTRNGAVGEWGSSWSSTWSVGAASAAPIVTLTSSHHRLESRLGFYKAIGYEASGLRFFKRL
jgi:hypothetical protein